MASIPGVAAGCDFSSDPAISSSIFVGAEWVESEENLKMDFLEGQSIVSPFSSLEDSQYFSYKWPSLRGAWRDRDTNDIFAHSSLFFSFLTSNFPTLFVFLNCILWSGSLLKIPSEKRKISEKPPKTP